MLHTGNVCHKSPKTMNKALISDLQSYFDGRARLNNAALAIKCYTKNPSLFYGYVDGWNNKKTVNIPIEPTDLLPILERYIENIDKEIINVSQEAEETTKAIVTTPNEVMPPTQYHVNIENCEYLIDYINGYANTHPNTYNSFGEIVRQLSVAYHSRLTDTENPGYENDDYHIQVCSDWENKIYVFSFIKVVGSILCLSFDEITKA